MNLSLNFVLQPAQLHLTLILLKLEKASPSSILQVYFLHLQLSFRSSKPEKQTISKHSPTHLWFFFTTELLVLYGYILSTTTQLCLQEIKPVLKRVMVRATGHPFNFTFQQSTCELLSQHPDGAQGPLTCKASVLTASCSQMLSLRFSTSDTLQLEDHHKTITMASSRAPTSFVVLVKVISSAIALNHPGK